MNARKKRQVRWLLGCSALLLALNFIPAGFDYFHDKSIWGEKHDPELTQSVRSLAALTALADRLAADSGYKAGSVEYALLLTELVEQRFKHGYSNYRFSQNWIANSAGFIKRDFAAPVIPDDILSFPTAACSQQATVLMAALRARNYDVRAVTFWSHFALEARVGDQWYFLDPNLEPSINRGNAGSIEQIAAPDYEQSAYHGVISTATFVKNFRHAWHFGTVNEPQGARVAQFHRATALVSKIAFLLPLALAGFLRRRRPAGSARSKGVTALAVPAQEINS